MWYASRSLFLIENEFKKVSYMSQNGQYEDYFKSFSQLEDILIEAKSYLEDAFQNEGTSNLLKWAVRESSSRVHFRDF